MSEPGFPPDGAILVGKEMLCLVIPLGLAAIVFVFGLLKAVFKRNYDG